MFDSFSSYFDKYELDTKLFDQLENYLNQDKKKEGKKLNLTFVTEIGQAVINQDCSVDEIIESIIFYKENY